MVDLDHIEINNDIQQLKTFYADFDFSGIGIDKEKIITLTANIQHRFKNASFENIKKFRIDKDYKQKIFEAPQNKTFFNSIKNDAKLFDSILDCLFINKYCFENNEFLSIIAFFYELIKDTTERQKKGEPLRYNNICDLYYKAQNKNYKNNLLILFDSNYLKLYINFFYDMKQYRITGKDLTDTNPKQYEFLSRLDLKTYKNDFMDLLKFFIDFDTQKPTAICYDAAATKKELIKNKLIPAAYKGTTKLLNFKPTDPYSKQYEAAIIKQHEYLNTRNPQQDLLQIKKERAEKKRQEKLKKEITEFRQNNPTYKGTDDELIKELHPTDKGTRPPLFDLFTDDELKKAGITFEEKKDDNLTFLITQEKNLKNLMNLQDQEINKRYGKKTLQVKRYIERFVLNCFYNTGLDDITSKKKIRIDAQTFNYFRGVKKDNFLTRHDIKNCLEVLTRNTIRIETNLKGNTFNIWNTPENKIDNFKKIHSDEIRDEIKKYNRKVSIEFNIIQEIIDDEKDPDTKQNVFYILLSDPYINYLRLLFINGFYEELKTNKIKRIKGKPNSKTPDRAEALIDYFFNRLKIDRNIRKEAKASGYEEAPFIYKISDLIKALQKHFNINKIKKDGYTKTIKEPLKETLQYLIDNKNIELYPPIDAVFKDELATKNNISKFEETEINITFYNKQLN